MSVKPRLIALYLTLALAVFACGSDDTTDISVADGDAQSQPDVTDSTGGDDPIPVEPDGGIGDGAEPLPGADQPEVSGTWHGAQVAETNCPGMDWKRVEASAFSFSVPADFTQTDAQPIDSEIGLWTNSTGIDVLYDYGWYSGSISDSPGAENEAIDYSGIVGEHTVIRDGAEKQVGVFFGEVAVADGQADRLSMVVNFTDAGDEIVGRCIVGSIEWNQ